MASNRTHVLPDATAAQRSGWPSPAEGDMTADPTSGRVMLYRSGAWQELTAAQAYKLVAAKNVSFTGGATGTAATDLSADVSIPMTVPNYTHYHRLKFVYAWFNGSVALGGGATYIPWGGGGSSDWGPGVVSGNNVLLPENGWWYCAIHMRAVDKTGAGTRTNEMWSNDQVYHSFEATNSDGAGRWGTHAQGWILAPAGGVWVSPYYWWNIANTGNQGWFSGIKMRD